MANKRQNRKENHNKDEEQKTYKENWRWTIKEKKEKKPC